MAKQKLPGWKVLEEYDDLCSKAFSRRAGSRVEVKLDPFQIPGDITKSFIFGARVNVRESEASVSVPSVLVVKKYIPGVRRTSEERDTTYEEFRKERAILDLDIHVGGSGEKTRIYPELYSKGVLECDREMIILREFIPGENLEQIAEKQAKEGGIKWEASVGSNAISDSLYPIALLHVQSPSIAESLKERGLLDFGTPEEAAPEKISQDRARRFGMYIAKLLEGSGKKLDDCRLEKLQEAFFYLDKRFVSRKDLLSIIDAELDVFVHHAMLKRIPDAGGVEVGGFVRDLALYSAPVFSPLWSPEEMPKKVLKTYFNVRRQFADRLRYDESRKRFNEEELALGILFASFVGNIRKSAAVVNYNGSEKGYPAEDETTLYLANATRYLSSFIGLAPDEISKEKAGVISHALADSSLGEGRYVLKDYKKPFYLGAVLNKCGWKMHYNRPKQNTNREGNNGLRKEIA